MCGCFSRAPYWGTWPVTQACALTGNQTSDLLVHRPMLNPLSHTSWGKTGLWVLGRKTTELKCHFTRVATINMTCHCLCQPYPSGRGNVCRISHSKVTFTPRCSTLSFLRKQSLPAARTCVWSYDPPPWVKYPHKLLVILPTGSFIYNPGLFFIPTYTDIWPFDICHHCACLGSCFWFGALSYFLGL